MLKHLRKFLLAILLDERGDWTTEMNVTGIAEIDSCIPEFWAIGIVHDGNCESFWGSLAGKEGSFMPVIDKTGPLKEKGDKITFNTIEQLMGTGVTGESVLKGQEEKLGVGSFTVTADIVRHAVAVSKKSTKQANFDEVQTARSLLKDWWSRKLDNDVFISITGSTTTDTIYANGKTSEATLNSTDGDYFGPTEINLLRMALIRQGAIPLRVTKSNGRTIPIYGIAYGEMEEYYLNQNTTFVNTVKEAWERFKGSKDMHPLFEGAVGIFRNMVLYPYYSLLQIPQGTPLRPETTLSATLITAGTSIVVGVAGNSNTKANYTLFFADSGSLQIEDEIISYTAKTVSTFTGLTRGASSTTSANHTAGKLVTQRNVASVIGFGAQAIFRAFPEDATPIGDNDDYGAQIGLGIEAYYGHKARIDKRRGKSPSLVICKCISPNPGTI
jgi:N4-gp56 family major capsid protein